MVSSSLAKKANEAYAYFEKATRTSNGADFWRTKDGAPQWVQDLCFAAHGAGAMLPDDWRYVFIVEVLAALSEGREDDIEADDYTSELSAWLASNVNRTEYVDEAADECGRSHGGIVEAMQLGQLAEKREVLEQVTAFLENLNEEDEDQDGDQEDGDEDHEDGDD
jgi:hypothetical protein